MALARTARIESTLFVGTCARVLDVVLPGPEGLGFVGGQYVIVDTGVDLPSGKRAKRAYSIVSSDDEQRRFRLAVQRLDPGPGSAALHAVSEGALLTFSGPWGKYAAFPSMRERVFIFATDTGITAAMGLLRASAFAPFRESVTLVWYACPADGFLSRAYLKDELGALEVHVAIEHGVPADHPERLAHVLAVAKRHATFTPGAVFLSGDGAVVHPLRDALVAAGARYDDVRVEAFFNNPVRKAPL